MSPFARLRLQAAVLLALVPAFLAHAVEKPKPWPADPFRPVTPERVAALPEAQREAWSAFLERSREFSARIPARTVSEPALNTPMDTPPKGGVHSRGLQLKAKRAWYASPEAQEIADRIVQAQSPIGGWTKGHDYTRALPPEDSHVSDVWRGGTFDNDATTLEMQFLARANAASPEAAHAKTWRESFLKGLEYVFAAQYPNGGFPQIFPLAGGYHDAITYNDNAMVQVLELLRDIAARRKDYAFVPDELVRRSETALQRGLACVLATQIRDASGKRTGWCQQYDALTQQPCAARNFEPIAACTGESAALVQFLMRLPRPSPEIAEAVDGAIAWFRATELHDLNWSRAGGLTAAPGAPAIWARYYEIGTNAPIFGDRNRTIHYAVGEISSERRAGYAWYGSWPSSVLEDYPAWSAKVKR